MKRVNILLNKYKNGRMINNNFKVDNNGFYNYKMYCYHFVARKMKYLKYSVNKINIKEKILKN